MTQDSSPPPSLEGLSEGLREAWESFIDAVEPLRPELFRFGYRLSGNAFDAEDLVHDGLLRAFGTLGLNLQGIRDMRSFLFRVLTNLWIDELRRSRPELRDQDEAPDPGATDPAAAPELREAAETLLGALSPRERAAVVLKEGFDLSHAQIAEVLSSSVGAVKVALHRGRQRLEKERASRVRRPRVSRALVDRFMAAFRARDLEATKALLLENVEAHVYPSGLIVGLDANSGEHGWLRGCFYHHIPEREASETPYPLGLQVREVDGEPVVLVFRDYGDGKGAALEEVWRFEEEDGRIARVRDYGFSPDLVEHVARHCELPFRRNGYRFRPGFFRDTNVAEVAL